MKGPGLAACGTCKVATACYVACQNNQHDYLKNHPKPVAPGSILAAGVQCHMKTYRYHERATKWKARAALKRILDLPLPSVLPYSEDITDRGAGSECCAGACLQFVSKQGFQIWLFPQGEGQGKVPSSNASLGLHWGFIRLPLLRLSCL